jgi:hypothetical protein
MPEPSGRGRRPIYCSGTCRKAAYDARRARQPGAFEVKVVERTVSVEHNLSECVERVIASPAACRRVLHALARAAEASELGHPQWQPVIDAERRLAFAVLPPR